MKIAIKNSIVNTNENIDTVKELEVLKSQEEMEKIYKEDLKAREYAFYGVQIKDTKDMPNDNIFDTKLLTRDGSVIKGNIINQH